MIVCLHRVSYLLLWGARLGDDCEGVNKVLIGDHCKRYMSVVSGERASKVC